MPVKIPDRGDPSDVLQLFPKYNLQVLCCRYWWLQHWEFKELSFPYWRIYYNQNEGAVIIHDGREIPLDPDKIIMIAPNTSYETRLFDHPIPEQGYALKGNRITEAEREVSIHANSSKNNDAIHDAKNEAKKDANIEASIEANTDFAYKERPHVRHLFIHFNLGIPFDHVSPGIFVFDPGEPLLDKINYLTNYLLHEYQNFSFYASLMIQSLISDLLARLPESSWNILSSDQRIRDVLKYIENNLWANLSNPVLADHNRMVTNSFTRLFRQEVGIAPQRYIQKKRIEQACILLHHSGYSIDEIASRTGFYDRFQFSKMFKKWTGVTPVKYRKDFGMKV